MSWKNTVLVLIYVTYVYCQNDTNASISGENYISNERAPYMASLRFMNQTEHICGGSIIHERFVLTSARCIVPDEKYQVLVGTHSLHNGGSVYDIEKILIHPQYSNVTFDHDVCILKLNETLTFGRTVDKMYLNDRFVKLKNDMTVKITGWGCTEPQGNLSERLHQVKIEMVLRRPCREILGPNVRLTRTMICARGNENDACKGDDGGPLLWRETQVGILSFAPGDGLPHVYTNIQEMVYWIRDTINENK